MTPDRFVRTMAFASSLVWLTSVGVSHAGQVETFRGRLSPVPVDARTAATTVGSGVSTASLAGNALTIRGTFEGLNSPARAARLHRAPPGQRGPSILELQVPTTTRGTIEGRATLDPMQVEDLKKGWLYVQIYTERNPDGHLRGWLFRQEAPR